MASPANNLFLRLHKWAGRQDENFTTECLAVVLEQMLVLAPAVGVRLVSRLTGGFIDLPAEYASSIQLQPQLEAETGRPDLEIRSPNRVVWIEVKVESSLRVGQLEGYRELLRESGVGQSRLVLLTRYPEVFGAEDAQPDLLLRWFQVADWVEQEWAAIEEAGEIASFLARQFLDFLEARRMTLAQVGALMPEGVRFLPNLLNMLYEAAAAAKVAVHKSASWENIGANLDGRKYWIGVIYSEPGTLWFGTRCRIDREAARRLGVGEVTEESWVPGGYRWWRGADLNSEPIHFFSRSKVSQYEWLEKFLSECLTQARSIETPDQPPIPDEPEAH
jgi:hypothetical protein